MDIDCLKAYQFSKKKEQLFFSSNTGGDEVRVEYILCYTKDDKVKLPIILRGSHYSFTIKKTVNK